MPGIKDKEDVHRTPPLFFSRTINMLYNGKEGDLQWSKENESSKASALPIHVYKTQTIYTWI
jgi:hypothetical protein